MKTLTLSSLLALALAAPIVHADTFAPKVVASVSADFDHDGKTDIAEVSTTPDETPELLLTIKTGDGREVSNANLVGKYYFQTEDTYNVHAKATPNGSLAITLTKDWGTSMWSTTMSIASRDGEFVIAGLQYEWSYREDYGSCDLNYLTGEAHASRNGKPVKINMGKKHFPFATTSDADVLATCPLE